MSAKFMGAVGALVGKINLLVVVVVLGPRLGSFAR
jgi:hypothetical protein